MEIPVYLAMTAAEVLGVSQLPKRLAWMSCHFSPYTAGLSNLPETLPEGAMLMLNDQMPFDWHDPNLAADILVETASKFQCDCILLDFQRPECEETASVIEAVLKAADCPVGGSSCYCEGFDCPVLVPPVPPHVPLEEYLKPWKNREIWLELAFEGTEIVVTEDGSRYTPLPHYRPGERSHHEEALHCHYEITVEEDQILFQLGRTAQDLEAMLERGKEYGITKAVGLWQELYETGLSH